MAFEIGEFLRRYWKPLVFTIGIAIITIVLIGAGQ